MNLLTTKELADALQVSERTVRHLAKTQRIPHLRVGRRSMYRFDLAEVVAALRVDTAENNDGETQGRTDRAGDPAVARRAIQDPPLQAPAREDAAHRHDVAGSPHGAPAVAGRVHTAEQARARRGAYRGRLRSLVDAGEA